MGNNLTITVPLVPPSVNHYKMRTRKGVTFVSKEAKAFKAAVKYCAGGRQFHAKAYQVGIWIFLGFKGKGDVDNFCKVVLDGLVEAQVIHSDSAISRLIVEKSRDVTNPRTQILIQAFDGQNQMF